MYCEGSDINYIETRLNEDLINVGEFFETNELIINLKKNKTESMLFGTAKKLSKHRNLELSYKNTKINFTKSYKYLGVNLDPTLSLCDHFN